MAARNTLRNKAARHLERGGRKALDAKRIPFHGVVVSRKDVLGQRYLAIHGMEFSRSVAAVQIHPSVKEPS